MYIDMCNSSMDKNKEKNEKLGCEVQCCLHINNIIYIVDRLSLIDKFEFVGTSMDMHEHMVL